MLGSALDWPGKGRNPQKMQKLTQGEGAGVRDPWDWRGAALGIVGRGMEWGAGSGGGRQEMDAQVGVVGWWGPCPAMGLLWKGGVVLMGIVGVRDGGSQNGGGEGQCCGGRHVAETGRGVRAVGAPGAGRWVVTSFPMCQPPLPYQSPSHPYIHRHIHIHTHTPYTCTAHTHTSRVTTKHWWSAERGFIAQNNRDTQMGL